MKLVATLLAVVIAGWLLTGCYVVRGDEQAVLRRFGRLQPGVRASGWHYDLPWPLTRIDRVKVHEVRTLTVGIPTNAASADADPLFALFRDRQAEFITGDKNIINVQMQVQYTVTDPVEFLLTSSTPGISLQVLTEASVTEAVAGRGVDQIQPLGLTDLRETVLQRIRHGVQQQKWGISVEDVAVGGISPPVEVKEAFLDVSNARAEKDRWIQEEQTRAEQKLAQARAASSELLERAGSEKDRRITSAKGEADRFTKVIGQLRQEATAGGMPYAQVRRLAEQRLFTTALEELLPKLAGKVLLEGQQPADVTIFPQKNGETAPQIPGSPLAPGRN